MKLKIKRVRYGKKSTPKQLREFNVYGFDNSPSGTLKEWKKYAKKSGLNGIEVIK